MKRFITIALVAIALAAMLVSCNKDNNKNTGVGFWKVESTNAEKSGSSSIYHAWYYYDQEKDGFDVFFSDENDFSNRANSNWAYVDLAKEFCGEEHSLTEDLDSESWVFYVETKTSGSYTDVEFTEGTVFLNVDMKKNSVILRLNGTSTQGDKVKIDYVGSARRMDEFVCPPGM